MRISIAAALLLGLSLSLAPVLAKTAPDRAAVVAADDPLTAMFVWWNAAYKQKNGFTKQSFELHFTPDAVMRINGRDSAVGSQDLADHFQQIQKRTEAVAIELPFIEKFWSADHKRIFTYHVVTSRADGKNARDLVMGYADIRGGKISLINFVSAEPAKPKPPTAK